jgi:hypothetical protein
LFHSTDPDFGEEAGRDTLPVGKRMSEEEKIPAELRSHDLLKKGHKGESNV